MGGRRFEGGQAVGRACTSLRPGGRKIRHRKARGYVEPLWRSHWRDVLEKPLGSLQESVP